jgi:hypothetical protein
MNYLVRHGTLPGSDTADTFHGHQHGNVPISMFLVHNRPGDGPQPRPRDHDRTRSNRAYSFYTFLTSGN